MTGKLKQQVCMFGTLQVRGTYLGPFSLLHLPGAANQHACANNLAVRACNLHVLGAIAGQVYDEFKGKSEL